MKATLKKIIPSPVWKKLRERSIVSRHANVAAICDALIDDYFKDGRTPEIRPLKDLGTEKIIWQYWAQGFGNVPAVVSGCLESVDRFKEDYLVIRLDDSNVGEYVEIPELIATRSREAGLAFYSDVLRLALLSTYGGVWLDATVRLSGPLPAEFTEGEFFMYQRDPEEREKAYWENTYAYYFGWAKGFRVNVLNSIIFSSAGSMVITAMYGLLSRHWENNETIPDYFFFQILFDVLINGRMSGKNCKIVSDCLPHLLQQYQNDPSFNLMSEEEIFKKSSIHKLTYKSE